MIIAKCDRCKVGERVNAEGTPPDGWANVTPGYYKNGECEYGDDDLLNCPQCAEITEKFIRGGL